jgi:imidazolonepropionase-like amidohydrolase
MYPAFIAYGVTGVREMAQRYGATTKGWRLWQQAIASGKRVGPRGIGPSADESAAGGTVRIPEDRDSMYEVIDSLKRVGDAFLKVHNELMSREHFLAILSTARKVGLPVVGHVPFESDAITASDSGMRSVEHITELRHPCWPRWPLPFDASFTPQCTLVARAFLRNGTWLTPTIAIGFMTGTRESKLEITRLMHKLGVPMLAGTDIVSTDKSTPGSFLHEELALLVDAGLTPLEALQTATLNPAKFIHATDSLGTVAPGKLADLVLLEADPLVAIRNTRKIWAVVANGRYFDTVAITRLREAIPSSSITREPYMNSVYLGYRRTANFMSPQGLRHDTLTMYTAPVSAALTRNAWGLIGPWTVGSERAVLATTSGGVVVRFHARYLTMAGSDFVEPFNPHIEMPDTIRFRIRVDGRPPGNDHGSGVAPDGTGILRRHNIELLHQQGPIRDRTVEIEFFAPVAMYSFGFNQLFSQ